MDRALKIDFLPCIRENPKTPFFIDSSPKVPKIDPPGGKGVPVPSMSTLLSLIAAFLTLLGVTVSNKGIHLYFTTSGYKEEVIKGEGCVCERERERELVTCREFCFVF